MERLTHFDGKSYQDLSSKVECVQKLGILEDAEEQDWLIILPCKIGDIIYTKDVDGIGEHIIHHIELDKTDKFTFYFKDGDYCTLWHIENHKYYFLTKEEAEIILNC